jgi:hypothetical protein
VRDFYFFKRSQYPQLSLVHKKPAEAYLELQEQAFKLKFAEMGKVMLIWGILKNVRHGNNWEISSFIYRSMQQLVILHTDIQLIYFQFQR